MISPPARDLGFLDGNPTGDDYAYDGNGNLILDRNKGITQITYNRLNLPATISSPQYHIAFTYDAAGTRNAARLLRLMVPARGESQRVGW